MAQPLLRQKLEQKHFFAAPGIHDMIAAVIARELRFAMVYGTGYWLTASVSFRRGAQAQ